MTDKIVVFNTCGSAEEAQRMARQLVEKRLAACVTIVPGVRSFYQWKGVVEDSAEWLLIIKTSRPLFETLRVELEKVHSYETPEVIALPIVDGSKNYLLWLEGELGSREGSPTAGDL